MTDIAIEFNNVGKQYRLGTVGTGTLSHDLNRFWQTKILRREDPYLRIGETNDRTRKGTSDFVWALRDISFKVEQGEVLGIIGKNGAGKSTLLKLLSNITSPTIGSIRYKGRIASLLEVGTGFHHEMTGRENIYMNGSIMGMTKTEITRKLDEIVNFAGVERYLDTPVKRYSSGMTVRLGFAVAAFLEPEILVVDEVLTVGDAEFQKKAIGKMNDVAHEGGRTVLFVSHNMAAVRSLCTRGVVLQNGMQVFDGTANDAVNHYTETNISDLKDYIVISNKNRRTALAKELEYIDIRMLNDVHNVSNTEPLVFEMSFRRNVKSIKECQFGILSRNNSDALEWTCYSPVVQLVENKNEYKVRVKIPNHNTPMGRHKLNFNISRYDYSASIRDFDIVYDVLSFEINYVDVNHSKPFSLWPFREGTSIQNADVELI